MNSGTNPIRSYGRVDGVTACRTPMDTDLPRWVIQTAQKWGLYWGGYGWSGGCSSLDVDRNSVTRDPPHFEFRGTPAQAATIAAFNLGNDPSRYCLDVVNSAGATVETCNRTGVPRCRLAAPRRSRPAERCRRRARQPHRRRRPLQRLPHARELRGTPHRRSPDVEQQLRGRSKRGEPRAGPPRRVGPRLCVPVGASAQHDRHRRFRRRRRECR